MSFQIFTNQTHFITNANTNDKTKKKKRPENQERHTIFQTQTQNSLYKKSKKTDFIQKKKKIYKKKTF